MPQLGGVPVACTGELIPRSLTDHVRKQAVAAITLLILQKKKKKIGSYYSGSVTADLEECRSPTRISL